MNNYPNFKDKETFKKAFKANVEAKYAIDFERYKNGQANEIIKLLDKANKDIAKFIKETDGVYTKARYKEIAKKLKDVSATLKENVDPIIADFLVPNCIYRGFCPEVNSCGYWKSDKFKKDLNNYRNLIGRGEE